jgi:hypothetical protein
MLPTIRFFIILLLFTLRAGFFMVPTQDLPDHAVVFLDDRNRTYLSPGCAEGDRGAYRRSTAAEARRLQYRPDEKCRETGGFSQEQRSLTGNFLVRLRLLPPVPSRWNRDGSWNW